MKKEKCYSCGGKGFYTQIHGLHGAWDFHPSEGFDEKPSEHKYPCSACNGTGFKQKPKAYKASSYERNFSHAHCWNTTNPACGMKEHTICCLCGTKTKTP